MIVYNVTIKIDLDVHDLWLKWMKEEHMARVLETDRDDIREVFYGNYRIIYRVVTAEHIDIITVHHGAMRLKFG